ncbi:uncharacterized protein LOC142852063 [Microtus pennsylvanicus]|uniref:uncharacterized protein LOC142852063 n=1 Tax=Microtus pennsylvanicus TaxID=10058 RepID=UPI003F6AA0F1
MAQAAAGSGAGRSAGGGGHGPRRAHTLALRLARTPAHTHTHTHSLTRAGRPPARRPLGLRAARGLSRHRGSGEGGGGGGCRGGGRGCRRRWRSRLGCCCDRRWRSWGPGRSPSWSRGRSPSESRGRGCPHRRRCPGGSPRPASRVPGAGRAEQDAGRRCRRRSGSSGVGGPGPGPDAASHSGRQRWRAGGSRQGRSHTLLFLLCGWRRVLSAFFFREETEGGEKYEIIHAGDEFTAK